MLLLAVLAAPSNAASRPRPRRGGALIDTRNRTDFFIKLPTDAPALALAASASRKPDKAAELLLHQDVLGGGGALFGACPDVATFHPTSSFPFNLSKFSGAASRAAGQTTFKPIGAAADAELASFGETTGAANAGDASLADSTVNSVGVTCGGAGAPAWCAELPQPLAELCVSEDPIEASGSTSNETSLKTATAHSKSKTGETDTKNKPVPGFTSGISSSAPGRARQRGQLWAALFLLLGACGGVLLSVRRSNSGRLVRCRTGARRGAWLLILAALLPLACAPSVHTSGSGETGSGEIGSGEVDSPPSAPSIDFQVTVGGGSWQADVSWTLTCSGALIGSGGAPYSGTLSAPPGECTLNMYDSYGDGWTDNQWEGDVEIIESTVTGCFAASGGVVYAEDSGAVSIIGSAVSGCSALQVRRVELAACSAARQQGEG
ncbi:hypothetical protein EMIHUDRAFT_240451 [Emiliania huxleyi CCMP1516]|uniref:TLDc domain-containing protein n=2 Tax=Emiliania huxleyi TaxID=2903 RepID=A0A0D3JFR4_EMIH1|nr:hypothetical protein EMIHUDRAFT_240451 [Emiliania huxleyi CCMP1516]EOD22349.1 hypothetical protein EMIHUDRAFT_240451 [Emiliania huxleyi CCMP1516]|eukprot:XP_005774778.1 hypothetical protein EMIHUDRAFT_240451 [Emiliania huxleyi CCMP1516]